MLSSLDNFIQAIAFGHARRDVQRYLDAATRSMYMHTASTSQNLAHGQTPITLPL